MTVFREWLKRKWRVESHPTEAQLKLRHAIHATFSTPEGQVTLQWLMDRVYCTISTANDPIRIAEHNAQRALVHEILEELDHAQHPSKYEPKEEDDHAVDEKG